MFRLKELRTQAGLSQQELSNKLSVSRSAVAMWERGTEPSNDMLQAIADYFDVSVDYLLGRNDSPSPPSLDEQLTGIDFALSGEIRELTDDEKRDILDYVKFKRSQRPR